MYCWVLYSLLLISELNLTGLSKKQLLAKSDTLELVGEFDWEFG